MLLIASVYKSSSEACANSIVAVSREGKHKCTEDSRQCVCSRAEQHNQRENPCRSVSLVVEDKIEKPKRETKSE